MSKVPIESPKPDFEYVLDVFSGKKKQDRVVLIELLIDEEIYQYIIENYFGEKYFPPPMARVFGTSEDSSRGFINLEDEKEANRRYLKQTINFFYRMGYDFFPELEYFWLFESLNTMSPEAKDTAILSKGNRSWGNEGEGMIRSWEDFEKFPWDKAKKMLLKYGESLELITKELLPEGMKIVAQGCMFEKVLVWILGYTGLFYKIYDEPDLVEAVFDEVGRIVLDQYKIAVQIDGVGALWHGDDLGFKTSNLLSPELLRKWIFPWFKKYSELAHENNMPFWFHACGSKYQIMDDLINDIKIDALHSFEDNSSPVIDFKKKYGDKIAILGGIDMDKLASLNEEDLRKHVRNVLDICMQGGRYALGAGNSISNFVPVKNYLAMLDEGFKWSL